MHGSGEKIASKKGISGRQKSQNNRFSHKIQVSVVPWWSMDFQMGLQLSQLFIWITQYFLLKLRHILQYRAGNFFPCKYLILKLNTPGGLCKKAVAEKQQFMCTSYFFDVIVASHFYSLGNHSLVMKNDYCAQFFHFLSKIPHKKYKNASLCLSRQLLKLQFPSFLCGNVTIVILCFICMYFVGTLGLNYSTITFFGTIYHQGYTPILCPKFLLFSVLDA